MTRSTSCNRAGRACTGGTRNGMAASRILRLARTNRCAMVASGTRNTAAISAVFRPQTERSVSGIRTLMSSAGWQHVERRVSSWSPVERRIEVGTVEHHIAADVLLDLSEGSVGEHDLTAAVVQGRRGVGRREPARVDVDAGLAGGGSKGKELAGLLRGGTHFLLRIHETEVLHAELLARAAMAHRFVVEPPRRFSTSAVRL